jgi:4'-phosphopantetheinyl transferase
MSAEEGARQERFVFEKDRHTHLVARGLMRTVLSRYTGVDPASWVFGANSYGKPEIAQPVGLGWLRFNLSHTSGLVVCVVAVGRDVGVDVENVDRQVPAGELARRHFSAREAADVLSRPAADQLDRFYDYWTLKEAYIKARGMGLSIPLGGFTFELTAGRRIGIAFGPEANDRSCDWQFAQLMPTRRHKIAIAVRREPGAGLEIVIRRGFPPAETNSAEYK